MFVPELWLGPSLFCPSLLQAKRGGCLCWRRTSLETRSAHWFSGPSFSIINSQLQEASGQTDFPTIPSQHNIRSEGFSGSQYKQSQAHFPRGPDIQMGFSAWLLPTCPGVGFQIFLQIMTSLFLQQGPRLRVILEIRDGDTPLLDILLSPTSVGQQKGNITNCEVKWCLRKVHWRNKG